MYYLISNIIIVENVLSRTYGISGKSTSIPDIHTDRALVEQLVTLCNREGLDESHLLEVVEDTLASI